MPQQRFLVYVDRLTCMHCAGVISKALTGLAGVVSVKPIVEKRLVDLTLDTDRTELDEVRSAIEAQGFEVRRIDPV